MNCFSDKEMTNQTKRFTLLDLYDFRCFNRQLPLSDVQTKLFFLRVLTELPDFTVHTLYVL